MTYSILIRGFAVGRGLSFTGALRRAERVQEALLPVVGFYPTIEVVPSREVSGLGVGRG